MLNLEQNKIAISSPHLMLSEEGVPLLGGQLVRIGCGVKMHRRRGTHPVVCATDFRLVVSIAHMCERNLRVVAAYRGLKGLLVSVLSVSTGTAVSRCVLKSGDMLLRQ
jgi:hypothetical protein